MALRIAYLVNQYPKVSHSFIRGGLSLVYGRWLPGQSAFILYFRELNPRLALGNILVFEKRK
jgi:hypothetical protein